MSKSAQLDFSDLRLWVHLGHSAEEKFHPQQVCIHVTLSFCHVPKAITTDKLEDTVCYFNIIEHIQSTCQDKSFNLIEHLTTEIHQAVSRSLGEKAQWIENVEVTVTKLNPPVSNLHGGVSFTYSG